MISFIPGYKLVRKPHELHSYMYVYIHILSYYIYMYIHIYISPGSDQHQIHQILQVVTWRSEISKNSHEFHMLVDHNLFAKASCWPGKNPYFWWFKSHFPCSFPKIAGAFKKSSISRRIYILIYSTAFIS